MPARAPSRTNALAVAAALVLGACSHDVVLPDETVAATCGNGVTQANEECDVVSPGCVNCHVQPEWTCTAHGCTPLCVDGVVGSGGGTDAGGGAGCTNPRRDSACDLTGYWAVRETTYLRDQVFGGVQVSSNWYLLRVVQTGTAFAITADLDCGVHVSGSATIDYPPATLRSLIWANPEDGTDATRGQRQGTSTEVGGGCAVTLAPWYFVRGVTTDYLPASFASDVPIETLTPLPSVADPVNGNVFPAGATAPTTAGIPGVGTLVSGLVPGVRYAAQRSTTTFTTAASVPAAALTLTIPGTFDVQENVLRVTQCGAGCPLLTSLATPATDLPPHATWSFIGKTLGSARVAPIVLAAPRVDIDLDIETCANVQALLPHDGTVPQ
jgi:hypothetical protein